MKKHIAFMISCIMLAVCFSFPVFATGQAQRRVTTSSWDGNPSVSGVYISAVASQLYGYADVSNSGLTQHAGRQDVIVTVTLTNNNNNDVGINGLYVRPSDNASTIRNINDFGIISGDVTIGVNSPISNINATFSVSPNENSSYVGNGTLGTSGDKYLVIPAKKSFSFSFYYSTYYGSSSSTDYVLSSLAVGCQKYISGDIPHGIAVDNSDIINRLNEILTDGSSDTVYDLMTRLYAECNEDPVYQDFLANYDPDNSWHFSRDLSLDTSLYYEEVSLTSSGFRIINNDYDIYNNNDGTNSGNRDLLGAIDVYVHLIYYAKTDDDIIINPVGGRIFYEILFDKGDWKENGTSWEMIFNDGIIPYQCNPYQESVSSVGQGAFLLFTETDTHTDQGRGRLATRDPKTVLLKYTYYFTISDVSLDEVVPVTISSDASSLSTGDTNFRKYGTTTHTIIWYITHWWAENHQDINQDISDDSGTVSDTESQIHAQEQQWYSDNESAIEATGLSNFEFSSGELDGLTQLRLQFSQVWGALGDWTLVYIFVLSLSLATFILRHRPTTKAQQRMADSERYRQDVRNRWAVQDARASNNSNGFSDDIWRRAGYR